jgi:capsular exopolysaccharide synthesis family protein
MSSESFRALRTRIQFSKAGFNAKTILITSCAPGEGKTIISANLASSFAKDSKKTIIIDCDLRKPRVHAIFKQDIAPGLTDYLFGKVPFEKIIRITETKNLDFVPAGTIQINPSEILNSHKMISALQKIRDSYEMVIIDSAPIMAVSDTEVLSNFVNSSILVVSANSTEISWIQDSIKLLKNDQNTFLGVVLNNYEYKFGYPSAYKYVGYYSSSKDNKKLQKLKKKIESS